MLYLVSFCIYASFVSLRQRFALCIYTKYCLKAYIYIEKKSKRAAFLQSLVGARARCGKGAMVDMNERGENHSPRQDGLGWFYASAKSCAAAATPSRMDAISSGSASQWSTK